ncbi:ABC transporter ATP-binding protein [Paenibacillus radicis (ex Gao et al. 2016)]|uniref:Glutamine ABC transporter ATP-binding protein n=1 Tax=Paenibacillus radicis (ex Gao et al. 2016) TaxID=1737354 RepID=A0A917HGN6_9BACL|nr:ATP-binding cassette domain-containing protein [Paenibacillus radicis (ex Gao et al. 2016)]GGG77490.1 glutamine ABC transporter ATP-binding protein [Paenibacillus radicis (ex Gao et al. 2016)]
MAPLLSMNRISKRRPDKAREWLFDDITAAIDKGERVALLGASGTGKSTLLRIAALLEPIDDGELHLEGIAQISFKPEHWRKKISYVAQAPVMLAGTVEQNLRTASELHGTLFDEPLARRCMAEAELGHLDWKKPAAELSGGEKQRTALVRSLLLRPAMLLLDETTSSLDPTSKEAVEHMLNRWAEREGTAMAWITHDMEQSRSVSDQIWFMGDGKLLERGDTKAFFQGPSTEQARRFIQKPIEREAGGNE